MDVGKTLVEPEPIVKIPLELELVTVVVGARRGINSSSVVLKLGLESAIVHIPLVFGCVVGKFTLELGVVVGMLTL